MKYSKVEDADWETCASVLNGEIVAEMLLLGWNEDPSKGGIT